MEVRGTLLANRDKIEEPGLGDPLRATPPFLRNSSFLFGLLNWNKKSVALNLKPTEGRAIFLKLAEQADAILETFRPGVVKRLGIHCDSVRKANPQIVYCSLSGYGQSGPYRERVGHDLNYVGLPGLLGLQGSDRPAVPAVPLADMAGGLYAALTILAALAGRATTGRGAYIDLAMTDVVVFLTTVHFAEFFSTGALPGPATSVLLGAFPCYAIDEVADGKYLTLAALETKFWTNLCVALERPQYIAYQFDPIRRDEIFADLRALFKTRSIAGWIEFLTVRDVPAGPLNNLSEALNDPQIRSRRGFRRLTGQGCGKLSSRRTFVAR